MAAARLETGAASARTAVARGGMGAARGGTIKAIARNALIRLNSSSASVWMLLQRKISRFVNQSRFNFTDAWLLTALFIHDAKATDINLAQIIARGDMLNRAIFTLDELQTGFTNLQASGMIRISESKLRLSPAAATIKAEILTKKVGLFSVIEKTLRKMNASKSASDVPAEAAVLSFDFLTQEKVERAYKEYRNGFTE